MRNLFPVLFLFLALVIGCRQGSNETATPKPTTGDNRTHQAGPQPTSTPVGKASPVNKSENSLAALKGKVGKTASEIKLFANKDIGERLAKMMGRDYTEMKGYWNVETPMEAEGDVLKLTGCQQHNCGGNMYVMYVDTANDNINVFHETDTDLKAYKETGEIKLPKKMADEFKQETENLKIQK